jgi:hypothetical protein
VANPDITFGGLFGDDGGQIVDAAGLFAEFEWFVIDDAEAGGIVATVFEPAQAFEDDVLGGFPANVADDATHSMSLSEVAQRRSNRPKHPGVGGSGGSQWRGLRIEAFYLPPTVSNLPEFTGLSIDAAKGL